MSAGIVIIPTYNEIENIERIIHAVFQLPSTFHVLIVDDHSPDGTFNKVSELKLAVATNIKNFVIGGGFERGGWVGDRAFEENFGTGYYGL